MKTETLNIIKEIKTQLNRADIILILVILLIVLLSFVYILNNKHYNKVEIYYENELFCECDLEKDQIIVVNEHNTIEIKNSKVRMKYSDCKNQQCVKMGWSDQYPIICVPNKINVKFKNDKTEKKDNTMIITY